MPRFAAKPDGYPDIVLVVSSPRVKLTPAARLSLTSPSESSRFRHDGSTVPPPDGPALPVGPLVRRGRLRGPADVLHIRLADTGTGTAAEAAQARLATVDSDASEPQTVGNVCLKFPAVWNQKLLYVLSMNSYSKHAVK